MKFLDIINESEEERLLKRGKTIFKAYKEGTITRTDGVSFSYVLDDNVEMMVRNGELELYGSVSKIVENTYCTLNERYMTELIENRFRKFYITTDLRPPSKDNIHKFQGGKNRKKPLNEDIDIDKERKRVKTVHKAIRKGIVNVSGTRYRYELPEEYTFHVVDEPHIQVTSIHFTFYNKDIQRDEGGGHGLPLKIWRIEEGKDVYINKMLTAQDVGDISYNDEYNINTKLGVQYVNVKNKVRNKYRNFDINCIMTTPSDSINESDDKYEQLKDLFLYRRQQMKKKGELIYKLYKKGKLIADREDGKIHYTYELSDGKLINVVPGDIFLSPDNIKIKYHNELTNKFALLSIFNYIKKKFHNHGITLRMPQPTDIYIDEWKESINESNEDKLIKKGKLIFKALRKGTIGSKDEPNKPMFTYELSNNMSVNTTYGDIIIYTDEIKVVELNEPCVRMSTVLMAKKIWNRFRQFKVELDHPPIHPLNVDCYYDRQKRQDYYKKEGLNENLVHKITDEDRKKVKLVHRAIRSGVVNVNDVRYRYELPENYEMSPANNKIIRIRFEFYRKDLISNGNRGNNRGDKLPLKLWRLGEGKDIYINGLLDNDDVSDICYGTHYHQKETTQEYMTVKNVVRRRYNNFNIALDVSPAERPLKTININLPINEQDDVDITDDFPTKEQKKRARIIYYAFKTGKFTVEDGGGTYKYVLPDEYYVNANINGELNIVLPSNINPQQIMKMYTIYQGYGGEMMEREIPTFNQNLHNWMIDNIEKKFKQFQINLIF